MADQEDSQMSFLYLAAAAPGYLKAGISREPSVRLLFARRPGQLYPKDASAPKLLDYAPGGRAEEKELHLRLAPFRVPGTGEWYFDTPEVREIATAFINDPKPYVPPAKTTLDCCPHCKAPLSPAEVKALWGTYTSAQRKRKSGGRNGGRPKGPKKGDKE